MSPVSPVFRPSIFDLVKTASVDKPPKAFLGRSRAATLMLVGAVDSSAA